MTRLLAALGLMLLLSNLVWADDRFSVTLPECSAALERRTLEPNVLIVRSECPLSLLSLSTLLDNGLQRLSPDQRSSIHGIYLGRVMDYPEWSRDLATFAAKSPSWNAKRGRPSKAGENENQRVRLMLNGQVFPKSLQPLLAKLQLTACIGDVEKVLVFKAKEIFPEKTAMPKGVSAEAKLPVDAQVWLRLQPLATSCVSH